MSDAEVRCLLRSGLRARSEHSLPESEAGNWGRITGRASPGSLVLPKRRAGVLARPPPPSAGAGPGTLGEGPLGLGS